MAEATRFIAEGAAVDWQDEVGNSPLHGASFNGLADIAMLLIKNKCNLNATDKNGDTPLIYAAYNNKMAIVRILVVALCDVTIRSGNKTAAEWAKERGNHAIAEYLTNEASVRAEGDPNAYEEAKRNELGKVCIATCVAGPARARYKAEI